MPSNWGSLLAGILQGGLPGAAEGWETGLKQKLGEDTLAQKTASDLETARHNKAVEEGTYTNLPPELARTLGLPEGRTNVHALGPLSTLAGHQAAASLNAQKDTALVESLKKQAAPEYAPETHADFGEPRETRAARPDLEALAGMVPGLGHEKVGPIYTELLKEQTPKITPHFQTTATGDIVNTPTDRGGSVVRQESTGLKAPLTRSAEYISARDRLIAEGKWGKPGDPAFEIQLNKLVEKILPVVPGAELVRKSDVGTPAPGEKASYKRLALTSEEGIKSMAASVYSVREMSVLAKEVATLGPDADSRLSLAFRSEMQGTPWASAIKFLEPHEQDVATRLRHAQLRYETSMAGLRGAGSPQMYDRFQKIVGQVYGATTPAALNALSRSMADFLQDWQKSEVSGGRQGAPFAAAEAQETAPRGPVAPPKTEKPWVTLPNGMRIQEQ